MTVVLGLMCYGLAGVVTWLVELRRNRSVQVDPAGNLVGFVLLWPMVVLALTVTWFGGEVARFAEWYTMEPHEEVE